MIQVLQKVIELLQSIKNCVVKKKQTSLIDNEGGSYSTDDNPKGNAEGTKVIKKTPHQQQEGN
jgi:hypothetical protein